MSDVVIPEGDKADFGKLVIDAALDDGAFSALATDPHKVIAGAGIDTSKLPPIIHVVQSDAASQMWLVVPDRKMVEQKLANIKGGSTYDFPPGYAKNDYPTERDKYNYRVGDYVMALCG